MSSEGDDVGRSTDTGDSPWPPLSPSLSSDDDGAMDLAVAVTFWRQRVVRRMLLHWARHSRLLAAERVRVPIKRYAAPSHPLTVVCACPVRSAGDAGETRFSPSGGGAGTARTLPRRWPRGVDSCWRREHMSLARVACAAGRYNDGCGAYSRAGSAAAAVRADSPDWSCVALQVHNTTPPPAKGCSKRVTTACCSVP